ncbi:MAG TPA: response regulator [Gemmatimonadales bacterium]|nr:response regulator [Gemmatimonadales bacterium]
MTPMVLVVDDEAIARNFIERALSQEGYQVVLASDGETALEILRSMDRKVALVITDLVMPGMGGHEFALEVGKLPSPPPVLYISAYEKPQGEMAQRFLQKPFSITDLTAAVARLLPRMASRGSRV